MLRKTFFLAIIAMLTLIVSSFLFAVGEWIKSEVEKKDVEFRAVYFTDARNGWAVGDNIYQEGMIAHTKNGATWTFYKADKALYDVFFISPKIGWAVGLEGTIATTTDGGKRWKIRQADAKRKVVTNNLYGVFFIDKKIGWAVGMGETILQTQDGGKTWDILMGGETTTAVGEGDIMLRDVYFMRKKVGNEEKIFGWAAGQDGVIWHTEDAEKTLKPSLKPEVISEIVSKTWNKQEVKDAEGVLIEDNLNDIFFADENNGWIVGAEGRILQTTDAGKTWRPVNSGTDEDLHDISFAPKTQIGWIVGTYGTILHTSDNGKTWQKQDEAVAKALKLNAVFAFDKNNCWIVGEWDTILRYAK